MENYKDSAIRKLRDGLKDVKGQKEGAMKQAVCDALEEFCRQDAEFAQAVVQGGSFPDCMKAVAKGVGSSISDLEAYVRAVRFYFPGAGIDVQMRIDLTADVDGGGGQATALREDKVIDLSAFF